MHDPTHPAPTILHNDSTLTTTWATQHHAAVQGLVIGETEMMTLNLHNNTLTYILVCSAVVIVLGILFQKCNTRGRLVLPMSTGQRL